MFQFRTIGLFFWIFCFSGAQAQADLQTVIRGGELLLNGLTIFKIAKGDSNAAKTTLEQVCIKNKLTEKITFRITGKGEDGEEIKKELVVQNDGKECLLELPKGIYTYEVILANKEIYKKGEYRFDESMVITIKPNS
ncbi:hypothetical protein [Flavobacterium sp.]|jgi:hypothetical protein|uniref:hypothetical protein n=1 Tax=Flavobacterium sp. TaxID=239 RepID=UPI0022C978A2|nr:hypothetical protein [Flavobacterium sp.]MCZ8145130.1 hypothetical protein [Flavobacterium sp.]MCZ8366949.1 hypothetical protein [Flavobacterium sp.]